MSRWLMRQDRGRNVRTGEEWKRLVERVFATYSTRVVTGLLRIPYVQILIECRKAGGA